LLYEAAIFRHFIRSCIEAMRDNFKKILEVLNDLIKINKDREEGYVKASRDLTPAEHNLRGIFERKAQESRNNVQQLQYKAEEIAAGDEVENEGSVSGKLYRLWMDVKSAFTGEEETSILKSCERGEKAAQHCYENALNDGDLPEDIASIIREQKKTIDSSREEIKHYIDSEPPRQ
jgi:uncharacterized protein (TIGR02284 family)